MVSRSFRKSCRLLTSSDFQGVFDQADFRASHRNFLILASSNQRDHPRLGLIIGKKNVRLATQRNRLKRHIRETFRHRQETLSGLDVIVLARKGMDELDNNELGIQLARQWQRLSRRAQRSHPTRDTG